MRPHLSRVANTPIRVDGPKGHTYRSYLSAVLFVQGFRQNPLKTLCMVCTGQSGSTLPEAFVRLLGAHRVGHALPRHGAQKPAAASPQLPAGRGAGAVAGCAACGGEWACAGGPHGDAVHRLTRPPFPVELRHDRPRVRDAEVLQMGGAVSSCRHACPLHPSSAATAVAVAAACKGPACRLHDVLAIFAMPYSHACFPICLKTLRCLVV